MAANPRDSNDILALSSILQFYVSYRTIYKSKPGILAPSCLQGGLRKRCSRTKQRMKKQDSPPNSLSDMMSIPLFIDQQ
jgi:hypothetical protein